MRSDVLYLANYRCSVRVQTYANAKIRNKSDPGFVFGLIWIRMSVVSVPKLWMHYLVGVSHFANGTNRLLIVLELRKQRNANKCPKIAYSSVVKKTSIALLSQRGRAIASIAKYPEHSFFYIISYFCFKFTSAYNSILFCYLRRNVVPCCHAVVYSARQRLVGLAL